MTDVMFHRSMLVETKGIDVKKRLVPVIASTEAIDGHGEIVKQNWDLTRYNNNPVVLWNHNRFAEGADALPLGHSEDVRVENSGTPQAALKANLIFASAEANPMADKVLKSFAEGSLRMVSVGFKPKDIFYEMHDEREVAVLDNNVLLEISPTPIGSNPGALAERRQKELAYISEHGKRSPALTRLCDECGLVNEIAITDHGPAGTLRFCADCCEALTVDERQPPTNSTSPQSGDANPEPTEVDMDLKETKAALAKTEAERDKLQERLDAFEAQTKRLETERDAAIERATKAEATIITGEVDALIGKKINPAERDLFVRLATTNRELFTEMIAARSDLTVLEKKIPAAPVRAAQHTHTGNGQAFASSTNRTAFGG